MLINVTNIIIMSLPEVGLLLSNYSYLGTTQDFSGSIVIIE